MTQPLPLADELAVVFARMSGLLLSQETVGSALRLVTSLAADTIPGTVGAGISLMDQHGRRTTTAASDAVVERADDLQYELGEGPCLQTWADRATCRVDELATESRWPRWCRAAAALGLHSVLSAPMVAGDVALGAIKVYSFHPGAYDPRSEHLLAMFGAQAAVLVANVQSYENARRLTDDLKDALRSRDTISVAMGIVMARDGIDEDAAFATLIGMSQRERKSVRDVAQSLARGTARRRR
ncbi:GAF and ANTAR domain-containing protein [Georgenia sp. SYP-B2076]|uniref:GAF and ANTAR domain-containing protein n=1 Tax=Georgenia sp. SYP-B2076 TaxID=2495881 RepID=UPI000F8F7455|nr:GAF and ANTAR domain-containing protein [Georgenia sp. SYP-B2076]